MYDVYTLVDVLEYMRNKSYETYEAFYVNNTLNKTPVVPTLVQLTRPLNIWTVSIVPPPRKRPTPPKRPTPRDRDIKLGSWRWKSPPVNEYENFLQEYDRKFKAISPFNVGCVVYQPVYSANGKVLVPKQFKTYSEILWDIHTHEKRIAGDSWDKMLVPLANSNLTVDKELW